MSKSRFLVLLIWSLIKIISLWFLFFYWFKNSYLYNAKQRKLYRNNLKITSIPTENFQWNYYPYKPKPNLLTDYELRFYTVLKYTLIDTNYIICPKVKLSDLLVVYDTEDYLKYFDYISKKSIDFLLCDKDTFKPQIAILLDDTNMDLDNPFFKHDELSLIFKASAFQLVRFKKFESYKITDIKLKLNIKDKVLS